SPWTSVQVCRVTPPSLAWYCSTYVSMVFPLLVPTDTGCGRACPWDACGSSGQMWTWYSAHCAMTLRGDGPAPAPQHGFRADAPAQCHAPAADSKPVDGNTPGPVGVVKVPIPPNALISSLWTLSHRKSSKSMASSRAVVAVLITWSVTMDCSVMNAAYCVCSTRNRPGFSISAWLIEVSFPYRGVCRNLA